jgi:hypothetical protein
MRPSLDSEESGARAWLIDKSARFRLLTFILSSIEEERKDSLTRVPRWINAIAIPPLPFERERIEVRD